MLLELRGGRALVCMQTVQGSLCLTSSQALGSHGKQVTQFTVGEVPDRGEGGEERSFSAASPSVAVPSTHHPHQHPQLLCPPHHPHHHPQLLCLPHHPHHHPHRFTTNNKWQQKWQHEVGASMWHKSISMWHESICMWHKPASKPQ